MVAFIENICTGCDHDVDATVACDAGVCEHGGNLCVDCVETCDACGWHFCADHFAGHVCTKNFLAEVA